jgi:hypothetical protein
MILPGLGADHQNGPNIRLSFGPALDPVFQKL